MTVSGYYTVFCAMRGSLKHDDDDHLDFVEFDTRVHEVELTIQESEPQRDVHLETEYFDMGYAELLFVFKGSYLERTSELLEVIDAAADELESSMNFSVDEKEIESIT